MEQCGFEQRIPRHTFQLRSERGRHWCPNQILPLNPLLPASPPQLIWKFSNIEMSSKSWHLLTVEVYYPRFENRLGFVVSPPTCVYSRLITKLKCVHIWVLLTTCVLFWLVAWWCGPVYLHLLQDETKHTCISWYTWQRHETHTVQPPPLGKYCCLSLSRSTRALQLPPLHTLLYSPHLSSSPAHIDI